MSKTEATDQIKFLVVCIGHTNNGRPDFEAVAQELGIVSKGAAHKRYERLLKSHGVTATSKTPTKSTKTVADAEAERSSPAGTPTAVRKRPASSNSSPNKKSKTNKAASVKKEEVDEGEDPVKKEEVDEQDDPVKEEETEESALSDAPEGLI